MLGAQSGCHKGLINRVTATGRRMSSEPALGPDQEKMK